MIKQLTAIAILSASLIAATPAHAQRFFDEFTDGFNDLARLSLTRAALDADNLVFVATMPNGNLVYVNRNSPYYEGGKIYFVEIQTNNSGFIRSFVHGDCSSGMMGYDSSEGWTNLGLVARQPGTADAYFAPGTYGRLVLNTACGI